MAKSRKNTSPHNEPKKRSAASKWLLAIFVLLLVWFIIWLLDWLEEVFGFKLGAKKLKQAAASTITGTPSTIQSWNTIEYQPIQNILQQTIENNGHIHRQTPASDVWVINHSWGKVPAVSTYDDNGNEIKGVVNPTIIETWIEPVDDKPGYMQYTCETVTITFSEPYSGFAVFP